MSWPVFDHVIFDFDSTLTEIEGIDVLAEKAGVGEQISRLTDRAMDGSIELEQIYQQRLSTIRPTRGNIRALKEEYKKHLTEDAAQVIAALHYLKHKVYIVSAGLLDPIIEIGSGLGIPKDHIKAVDLEYDEFSGEWWLAQTGEFNRAQAVLKPHETELEKTHGKASVIRNLLADRAGRSVLIGDGTSDLAASSMVDLFVGYTGVKARHRIVQHAQLVLSSKSLAPIIVLASGPTVDKKLAQTSHQALSRKAYNLIDAQALRFNDRALKDSFVSDYRRAREEINKIF